MTILDNGTRDQYVATASQTVFAYTFEVFVKEDLAVKQNGTLLSEGTDYTVSNVGNDSGGNVTLTTGATAGDIITIYRDMELARESDFQQSGDFLASEINANEDRQWAALQQVKETSERSIRAAIDDTKLNSTNTELANVATRAGKVLGFDSTGGLEYVSANIATGDWTYFSTVAAMQAATDLQAGDVVVIGERANSLWDITTATANGYDILEATGSSLQAQIRAGEVVSIDAVLDVDGTDQSVGVQRAMDTFDHVVIPKGTEVLFKNVTLSNDKIIGVHGTAKLPAGSNDTDTLFLNSDQTLGNSGIIIYGSGTLDGNKSNQSGSKGMFLVNFVKPTDCHIIGFNGKKLNIKNNYWPTSYAGVAGAVVYFEDPQFCSADNLHLDQWEREGVRFTGTALYCSVTNITGVGDGQDAWSLVQIEGAGAKYNIIDNVIGKDCGASTVGMDSQYSVMSNVVSINNTFQNGINFGHSGKPASYSSATNLNVFDAGSSATTGTTHNGISFGGGTTDFRLTNATVDTTYASGINVSDGASEIWLSNIRVKGAGQDAASPGLKVFEGKVYVSNANLSGNSAGSMSVSGTGSDYELTNVLLDGAAAKIGFQDISGLGAGGTVTVTNANARVNSKIIIEPSNVAGANAVPFISAQNDGSFVITTVNSGAAGAGLRWRIV